MCQCDGSRFDITPGAVVNGPATRPLTVYEVREIDGDIQIRGRQGGRRGPARPLSEQLLDRPIGEGVHAMTAQPFRIDRVGV